MNKHTEHTDNEQRINRNSQPRKQQPTIENKEQDQEQRTTHKEQTLKNINISRQQKQEQEATTNTR